MLYFERDSPTDSLTLNGPRQIFRVHDWRGGVTDLGDVPAAFVREVSEGAVNEAWTAQIANLLAAREHDLILSIGQVVPHEVAGMANHNKNLLIGAGGPIATGSGNDTTFASPTASGGRGPPGEYLAKTQVVRGLWTRTPRPRRFPRMANAN